MRPVSPIASGAMFPDGSLVHLAGLHGAVVAFVLMCAVQGYLQRMHPARTHGRACGEGVS